MAGNVSLIPLHEFNPDAEIGLSVAKRWGTWLAAFNMYIVASGITDNTRKRALLLYMAGARVREIFSNLTETGEDTDFKTAHDKLTEYFAPQENTRYGIYRFRQLQQNEDESLDAFSMRLRTAAENCEFGTRLEEEMEQQIIIGGHSTKIRKKALRDTNYKLKDMLLAGRGKEFSTYQAKEIEINLKSESIEKVSIKKRSESKKCFNCGGEYPHAKVCPARGERCENCRRYNHFASCCRQKYKRVSHLKHEEPPKDKSFLNESISRLHIDRNNESSNSSSDEYLFIVSSNRQPKTKVIIKGQYVNMTIDTGASINVMDEETFNRLRDIKLKKD